MDPEVAEKIKYAKFKAADIIRALKEGRAPVPGPPGGIPETGPVAGEEGVPPGCEQPFSPPLVEHLSIHPSTSPHHPQPSTTAPSPSHPSPQNYSSTAKTGPSPTVQKPTGTVPTAAHYSGTSSPSELVGESRYDYKVLSQAQRHAKFAISSLQYDDITSAMENLQKAMDLLKPYVE